MGFLSSTVKILEDEKEWDEKIIVYLLIFLLAYNLILLSFIYIYKNLIIIILKKIDNKYFEKESKYLYKPKDAIDSLFNIMMV